MLRDFLNIKKLKKQEQNSSRDEKLNKNLLHRKNKNKNRAERRLKRASKMKKYQLEKTGEISRKKRIRIAFNCYYRFPGFNNKGCMDSIS